MNKTYIVPKILFLVMNMRRKDRIYQALKNAPDGIGNRQLSRLTNMPSSTVQYNLQKLVSKGLVVQDPLTRKYFTRENYIKYKTNNVKKLLHSVYQDINIILESHYKNNQGKLKTVEPLDMNENIPSYIVFTGDDFNIPMGVPPDFKNIFVYYADKILAEDEDIIRLLGYILLIGFNTNPYLEDLDYEITSMEQLREYLDKHDFGNRLRFIYNSLIDGLEKAILYNKEAVITDVGVELSDEDYIDIIDRWDLVHDLQWLKVFYNPYMLDSLLIFLHHFIYNYDVKCDDLVKEAFINVMKNRDKLYDFFSKLSSIKFIMIVPFNLEEDSLYNIRDVLYVDRLLYNPVRMAIIKFLYERKEGSWKELVDYLKELSGKSDLNTINSQLDKLITRNIVVKEDDVYKLSQDFLNKDYVKFILNRLKAKDLRKNMWLFDRD